MNRDRSNITAWPAKHALSAGLLLLSACGQQAGEDYRGEPLLHMRGQAVVSALTGGQPIEPALCFFGADLPKAPEFDGSNIPADLREKLSLDGMLIVETYFNRATHILDVESRGEFPAQFDVEVYLPPPSLGLSAPYVAGEPRFAFGTVCAVSAEHPAVTFTVASGGFADPSTGEYNYAIASLQTSRFYYEAYECPDGTLPQNARTECTKTTAGDPSLAYEFPTTEFSSESVLGTAKDIVLLYLAEAAPPGSFTAWQWGAANGLSAGYHLFPVVPQVTGTREDPAGECQADAGRESERLNREQYNARIKAALGDDYVYNGLSAYSAAKGGSVELPEDIFLGARENEARVWMESCPLQPRAELDPSTAQLSIDLASDASPDLSKHLGFVTIGSP